jgi:hypothetical protein
MSKIDVICERCLSRDEKTERLIQHLQERLKPKEEQYEAFKYVAKLEMQRRKGFLQWLFG